METKIRLARLAVSMIAAFICSLPVLASECPEPVGAIDRLSVYIDVAVSNGYAYVTDEYAGLFIFDVSDPSSPVRVGITSIWKAHNVAVSGSYAYVTDIERGLWVVDVSTPSAPVKSRSTCTFLSVTCAAPIAISPAS